MKIATLIRSAAGGFTAEVFDELLLSSRARLDKALKRIRRPQAAVGIVQSALGNLLVAVTDRGLALNYYIDDSSDVAAAMARLRLAFDPVADPSVAGEVGAQVNRYLAGEANALHRDIDFTLAGNAFQKRVLDRLAAVPRGAVITYQALGAAAGSPSGARAVGNALHNNPVPIYVPCHRVIPSDRRIGGYGGGAARKLRLLRSEGFGLDHDAVRVPGSTVWGHKATKIYCALDCHAAARVDRARQLLFAGAQQAALAGMRPCKICRPG